MAVRNIPEVPGYLTPTIGSTSVASGSTVTTIDGLTLTAPILGDATATTINTLVVGMGNNNVVSNTGVGLLALESNTTGSANTALGWQALNWNTSGYSNTAVGYQALEQSLIGHGSTAVGVGVLRMAKNHFNTGVGFDALEKVTTAQKSVGIGAWAGGQITTGSNNVMVGYESGNFLTTGIANTAIGYQALWSLASGGLNAAFGSTAGELSTGANNTFVGSYAGRTATTGSNNMIMGYDSAPSVATVSNEITLGNASITRFRIPGLNLDTDTATNGQLLSWNDSTGKFAWTTPTASFPASAKATIQTNEECTSMAYTNLITPGPTVTLTTGTKALVIITAQQSVNSLSYASFAVSGATTIAAIDDNALILNPCIDVALLRSSAATVVTLNAGSNTFTMKYKTFFEAAYGYREIFVMNLA